MDVFLKFEFRVGRSPNFGATGGQKSPFSYSTHIAYTTALCYRTGCDMEKCGVVMPIPEQTNRSEAAKIGNSSHNAASFSYRSWDMWPFVICILL